MPAIAGKSPPEAGRVQTFYGATASARYLAKKGCRVTAEAHRTAVSGDLHPVPPFTSVVLRITTILPLLQFPAFRRREPLLLLLLDLLRRFLIAISDDKLL